MNLPPLRTIRHAPEPESGAAERANPATTTSTIPGELTSPRLPLAFRELVVELLQLGLIDNSAIVALLSTLGDRLPRLTNRDLAAEALVVAGALTRYQHGRVVSGATHGLVLGSYRVLDRIGSGTVGVVFLGEHRVLQRPVALKVLPIDDSMPPTVLERFHTECRALARLNHPHIVAVFDTGVVPAPDATAQTLHYLVLELAGSGDLEEYVYRRGPQSPETVARWGRQIASGLLAAHHAGLVHRDLKPSNLVLASDDRVKILDFGLTRELTATQTLANAVLGSLDFVAPEQLTDAPNAGPPADVYSLGVTLFWLLTGQLPRPPIPNPAAALEVLKSTTPKRLRAANLALPVSFDELIHSMLMMNPADRPTTSVVLTKLAELASVQEPAAFDQYRETITAVEQSARSLTRELDSVRAAVLTGLRLSVGEADGESPGHCRRVGEYTRVFARVLGNRPDWTGLADPTAVDTLARCAAVHDLGRVPAAANRESEHTELGTRLVEQLGQEHDSALPFFRTLRAVVRHHHERWDGTGSPDQLSGTGIPPAARIVAVAVAYDDLRRGEGGTAPLSHSAAMAAIRRGAITAYDPAVVTALVESEATVEQLFDMIPDREEDVLDLTVRPS